MGHQRDSWALFLVDDGQIWSPVLLQIACVQREACAAVKPPSRQAHHARPGIASQAHQPRPSQGRSANRFILCGLVTCESLMLTPCLHLYLETLSSLAASDGQTRDAILDTFNSYQDVHHAPPNKRAHCAHRPPALPSTWGNAVDPLTTPILRVLSWRSASIFSPAPAVTTSAISQPCLT